jgi:hypothetical protein
LKGRFYDSRGIISTELKIAPPKLLHSDDEVLKRINEYVDESKIPDKPLAKDVMSYIHFNYEQIEKVKLTDFLNQSKFKGKVEYDTFRNRFEAYKGDIRDSINQF